MQNSFTIKQDLTFKDFFSSTLYYYFSGRSLKRFFLIMFGVTFVAMFFGFATSSRNVDFSAIIYSFAPLLLFPLAVIVFAFILCLYIYKSKPYLFENVSYDFTFWGVVRHGEKTEFSKPWRDITNFKETKAFFLLYVGNTDFHIIQKCMFLSQEELNEFKKLLQENIQN